MQQQSDCRQRENKYDEHAMAFKDIPAVVAGNGGSGRASPPVDKTAANDLGGSATKQKLRASTHLNSSLELKIAQD